jgi:hypothetical protein
MSYVIMRQHALFSQKHDRRHTVGVCDTLGAPGGERGCARRRAAGAPVRKSHSHRADCENGAKCMPDGRKEIVSHVMLNVFALERDDRAQGLGSEPPSNSSSHERVCHLRRSTECFKEPMHGQPRPSRS